MKGIGCLGYVINHHNRSQVTKALYKSLYGAEIRSKIIFTFLSKSCKECELKQLKQQQLQNTHANNNNSNEVAFPASSRMLYWEIVKKIETSIPTSKWKYEEQFPTTDLPWQEIYLLPRRVTIDSKTREFQYKFLNRIVYTNN